MSYSYHPSTYYFSPRRGKNKVTGKGSKDARAKMVGTPGPMRELLVQSERKTKKR